MSKSQSFLSLLSRSVVVVVHERRGPCAARQNESINGRQSIDRSNERSNEAKMEKTEDRQEGSFGGNFVKRDGDG